MPRPTKKNVFNFQLQNKQNGVMLQDNGIINPLPTSIPPSFEPPPAQQQQRRPLSEETSRGPVTRSDTVEHVKRGSRHQGCARFPVESRGRQCTACAAVALGVGEAIEPSRWSEETIDKILDQGDSLYRAARSAGVQYEYLHPSEVPSDFSFDQYKIHIAFQTDIMQGQMNDLCRELQTFFDTYTNGVVVCGGKTVAVRKRNGAFWLFDSHSTDEKGEISPDGTASMRSFHRLETLVAMIKRNTAGHNPWFSISAGNISFQTDINVLKSQQQKRYKENKPHAFEAAKKRFRQENKVKLSISNAKYRAENIRKVCKYREGNTQKNQKADTLYREKNKETKRKAASDKYEQNRKRMKSSDVESRAQNQEKVNRTETQYRQRRKGLIQDYNAKNYGQNKQRANSRISLKPLNFGEMKNTCPHCNAQKWSWEPLGLCCNGGKVQLPPIKMPHDSLHALMTGQTAESKKFRSKILEYNGAFQMTSIGMKQVPVRSGTWQPSIRIQGKVYHLIGSMIPPEQAQPQFCQIYFLDGSGQREARQQRSPGLDGNIVDTVQNVLNSDNNYVTSFQAAMNSLENFVDGNIVIDPSRRPTGEHSRRFNLPETSEVAILLPNQSVGKRDILIRTHDNKLQRISETHRSYDPLAYVLLFPHGDDGWHTELKMSSGKTLSVSKFYSFRLMVRPHEFNPLHYGCRLLQQYVVDQFAKMESNRLNYLRHNQSQIRAESYQGLMDAVNAEDGNLHTLGRKVILPSTYTGSPRYMMEKQADGMAIVQKYGTPHFFITTTASPSWKEITDNLYAGQTAPDRPDIVARVFRLYVKDLLETLTKNCALGSNAAHLGTIEFQKRGLPHIHLLVWNQAQHKPTPNQIDEFVSAEIPDPVADPEGHDLVMSKMVHGPCGTLNPNSPCMENGKCTKHFPKPFRPQTVVNDNGYPDYRRRSVEDGGFTGTVNMRRNGVVSEVTVDNRWIVPHNIDLLKRYQCHQNVEIATSIQSVKYVISYIQKGSDMASFCVSEIDSQNEIERFQIGRYVGPVEAVWRLFEYEIHFRFPNVERLQVHLENGQRVYFDPGRPEVALSNPRPSRLTAFMELCKSDDFARTLLYREVPEYYTFNGKQWNRRKQGKKHDVIEGVYSSSAIGRVFNVSPKQTECFYLRLLLQHVRGPQSFEELKAVDEHTCSSFREACLRRGLIENDQHWDMCLEEASIAQRPKALRALLAIILMHGNPGQPHQLWENHKESLCEDIMRRSGTDVLDQQIEKVALSRLQDHLNCLGGPSLSDYGFPAFQHRDSNEVRDDTAVVGMSLTEMEINMTKLNAEQKAIHDHVIMNIGTEGGGMIFIDAPGGTGKTFLLNLILASVRHQGKVAVAVASSGVASTLLEGGQTAHSCFKIPLCIKPDDHDKRCAISERSPEGEILRRASLVIWDEAPMVSRFVIETVSRTLKDLRGSECDMGGVTAVFAGDFRQILPVVVRGTKANVIDHCLKSSPLWHHMTTFHLTQNMRLLQSCSEGGADFSEFLLSVGEGRASESDEVGNISLPPDMCFPREATIEDVCDFVYPSLPGSTENDIELVTGRGILAPLNSHVDQINDHLIEKMAGDAHSYLSIDTMEDPDDVTKYPVEFLNSLTPSGIPPHVLKLKVGCPIHVLRNLNPPRLCNGTKLMITKLSDNVIEAKIAGGPFSEETVFIPRIPLTPSESSCPIQFRRLQFPVRAAFAFTINKSQGSSLKVVAGYLPSPVFTHGQLYVLLSRATARENIKVFTPDGETTANVVYKEVFNML